MDYLGNQCPVCEKNFHADDDIVVCPDCGTPHHRECWEALGHCHNEALHAEGYDFAADSDNHTGDVVLCPACGKENDKNAFFCKHCAAPLSQQDRNPGDQTDRRTNSAENPASAGVPYPFMDPLGGVPGDTDMGDGVTAGEIAKYVKQNTPYFVRVFHNIREFNRSRFSFCGALFCGGYLLYRKMYKVGALVTALQAAMMILSTVIRIQYASLYQEFANQYVNAVSITQMLEYFSKIASADKFVLYLPTILSILMLIMRIVVGITVNRLYFKHCKQQIIRIKSEVKEPENPETVLQTKGGVNMPLAVSLLVTNLIISYLPGVIQALF